MNDFLDLKKLLEEQFGQFVREPKYKQAFEDAMSVLSNLSTHHSPNKIDTFYLFLHVMILKAFERIEELENRIKRMSSN